MDNPTVVQLAQAIQGPILAGLFFNLMLLGISITQVYLYFNLNKEDKLWMRRFILVLFILDILNSVFDMVYVYSTLINHNGEAAAIENATWAFAADPMLTSIIGCLVQVFFGWRVKVLTGSRVAAIGIWFFAVLQCLGGLATGAAVLFIPAFFRFQVFQETVIIWLVGSAVCDVMITLMLVWYLRKHRTGFAFTDDVIDRIIRLTVQTGMITAVVACIDLILYLVSPKAYHLVFNFMLAKLYTNSLLSSLNARRGWAFSSGQSQPSADRAVGRARPGDVINLSQISQANARPQVFVEVQSHRVTDQETGMYETKTLPSDISRVSDDMDPAQNMKGPMPNQRMDIVYKPGKPNAV